jgi:hypothetical protein
MMNRVEQPIEFTITFGIRFLPAVSPPFPILSYRKAVGEKLLRDT